MIIKDKIFSISILKSKYHYDDKDTSDFKNCLQLKYIYSRSLDIYGLLQYYPLFNINYEGYKDRSIFEGYFGQLTFIFILL